MNKLIKISIWLTLSELAFNLSGYVIHAFLGRFLGPAEYGRFSLVITFSTMIVILIGRGIPISMSKYLSEIHDGKKEDILFIKKRAARLQMTVIGLITAIYFFASPLFARLLHDESLTNLFRISSLIIPSFAVAAFYISYFNGIHQFNKQSTLKFVRSGARVLVILGMGYLWKTGGAIIGQALAPLSVFIAAFFLDPFRKIKFSVDKSKEEIREMTARIFKFAWPVTLFLLFYELMITIDLYLIKSILRDDHQAGLYNAALTVGRIPYYAFYFLSILLLPKISQSVARKMEEKTKKILTLSFRFMLMLLIPSIALLSYFSPSAIRFFYGAKYTDAAPAMSILVFGVGFLTIFYILTFVLNGAGKNRVPMIFSIIGAVLNATLNYFFIQRMGLIGSALATTITAFVVMVPAIIYASKNFSFFLQPRSIFKYLTASGIIYFIAVHFFGQGRFIFFIWSAVLFIAYFGLLFLFKEIKKSDWDFFFQSISHKK